MMRETLMVRLRGFVLPALLLLAAATGCVQPVTFTPPAEREVFVKAILVNGTEQQVTLLYSGGIGDHAFDPVPEAEVFVTGPGSVRNFFRPAGGGRWEGAFRPKAGTEYVLHVIIPGRDTLTGITTFPNTFSISSLIVPPEQWADDRTTLPYEEWNSLNPWRWGFSETLVEQMKKSGGTSLLSRMPGLIFQLDQREHHHLYILGRREDSNGKITPIRELATNHLLADASNMNGRRFRESGTIDTSRRQSYERAVRRSYEGLPLHDAYLRIDYPANYDNGLRNIYQILVRGGVELPKEDALMDATRYFAVVGDFEYNIWGANDPGKEHPVLYFCSVSEEYDRYLERVQRSLSDAEGDMLSSLYRNEAGGYTNIRNGLGVFGAVSVLRHDCDLQEKYVFVMHGTIGDGYPAYPALLPEL